MIRKIIHIDEEKCNGCGLCANACHEGAIDIIDGKAKLVRENFCDGFGDCLPNCPTGAITFEEREAPEYDAAAVKASQAAKAVEENKSLKSVESGHVMNSVETKQKCEEMRTMQEKMQKEGMAIHREGGCPGSRSREIKREHPAGGCPGSAPRMMERSADHGESAKMADGLMSMPGGFAPAFGFAKPAPELVNWPVQIKLAPVKAPYFENAKLLIAADCTAYAYASFHQDFIRGRIALIGCPKLDAVDYSEKLTEIIRENNIKDVTIVRMEVPCCGGLEFAAKKALQESGKFIPWQVVTIGIDGRIIE